MKTILNNEAIKVNYDADRKMLYVVWTSKSENISDDFFRDINQLYVDFSAKNQVKTMFLNTKNFLYTISVEMQEWVNSQIILKLLDNGIFRFAFLMSQEFVSQLSIEQTMEEAANQLVRYFDEETEAINWLIS